MVLVLGLLVTGTLAAVTAIVNNSNENHLLQEQVREAGTVLTGALPDIETPLASGAAIAGVTDGQRAPFEHFISTYVGAEGPFVYAALCGTKDGAPVVLSSAGVPSADAAAGGVAQCQFVSGTGTPTGLSVKGIVDDGTRLGYQFVPPGSAFPFGVYAETELPPHRRAAIPQSSAFSNLDFALYLGRKDQESNLLETTAQQLPITGRKAATLVPFANTDLVLVGTPTQPLGGSLSRDLTLLVILFGVVLTVGAVVVTERLVRRRRSAEVLAVENRRLYGEQQTVSSALQRALLPKVMPDIPGVEIATRYEAGLEVMDIGGDWFDVIKCPDTGFIFVVGDVSGRGVQAAVVMASLHYAIRAYAAAGDSVSAILTKLCALLDVDRDGHFATVLCGHIDGEKRQLTLASAGHLPPVLVSQDQGDFVALDVGPPIGTFAQVVYPTTVTALPPAYTLLAFTDGLVERRGEAIDTGMDQVREVASRGEPLARLLSDVVSQLTPQGSDDDIAILGLRWAE